jgi:arylsulfatase A-like enzyme
VLKCWATEEDDPTEDPQFGRVGKQRIENTGPLPIKRMETVDEEFLAAALDFIDRKTAEGKPWLCYFNPTRMHVFTHLKPESVGKTGLGVYADGMVELDGYVGQLLDRLDELGVADNTIVVFTTDNGAEKLSWPDGGASPFRGEKDTNWEGGFRVPFVMRWPGVIEPGLGLQRHVRPRGPDPDLRGGGGRAGPGREDQAGLRGRRRTFKVHLDGFNLIPYLKGEAECTPRKLFLYWSDDGELLAVRYDNWKLTFSEQRVKGRF